MVFARETHDESGPGRSTEGTAGVGRASLYLCVSGWHVTLFALPTRRAQSKIPPTSPPPQH